MNGDELRGARRERVFEAMDEARLDVMVLGRRDSVAYATGAVGLWTAGTRPFGAAAVLVGGDRSVHLLSTWDTGVPPEVPFENLYGVTWNPALMSEALGAIDGLATARRIGVDALSPGFARAAGRLAPTAELVPADDVLGAVRAVKLPAEVGRIAVAVGAARSGVDAAAAALRAGASTTEALAVVAVALAERGSTVPTSAPVVAPVADGLVHVDVGVLVAGYEGGLGRTVVVDGSPDFRLDAQATAHQRRLLDACRPGATAAAIREAAEGASGWMVRGTGMGFERPVVTASLGDGVVLAAGNVLSVEITVEGIRRRDLAHLGADGTAAL